MNDVRVGKEKMLLLPAVGIKEMVDRHGIEGGRILSLTPGGEALKRYFIDKDGEFRAREELDLLWRTPEEKRAVENAVMLDQFHLIDMSKFDPAEGSYQIESGLVEGYASQNAMCAAAMVTLNLFKDQMTSVDYARYTNSLNSWAAEVWEGKDEDKIRRLIGFMEFAMSKSDNQVISDKAKSDIRSGVLGFKKYESIDAGGRGISFFVAKRGKEEVVDEIGMKKVVSSLNNQCKLLRVDSVWHKKPVFYVFVDSGDLRESSFQNGNNVFLAVDGGKVIGIDHENVHVALNINFERHPVGVDGLVEGIATAMDEFENLTGYDYDPKQWNRQMATAAKKVSGNSGLFLSETYLLGNRVDNAYNRTYDMGTVFRTIITLFPSGWPDIVKNMYENGSVTNLRLPARERFWGLMKRSLRNSGVMKTEEGRNVLGLLNQNKVPMIEDRVLKFIEAVAVQKIKG